MFQLTFTEHGLSGLIFPHDNPDAATLAERYQFLHRIAPYLLELHEAIQGGEDDDQRV